MLNQPKQAIEDEYGDISKDERIEIFISLLKEKDVGATSRWDRIQPKICFDRRFRALATQTGDFCEMAFFPPYPFFTQTARFSMSLKRHLFLYCAPVQNVGLYLSGM